MKLELKHICPYLPYGLNFLDTVADDNIITIESISIYNTVCDNYGNIDIPFVDIKPILRPLSDLTKEIEHNRERFVPIERLRKDYSGFYFESNPELLIKSKNTSMYISLNWTNEFQQKLYEWKFDVFGLIPNGLAIDINTLTNDI